MQELVLKPVKMNEEIMRDLEDDGLIIRLYPSRERHRLNVEKGMGKGGYLYKSDAAYGPHSLVNAAIDNEAFSSFATHPDNEEILLLGGIKERSMYLLIARLLRVEFIRKLEQGTLAAEDFVCLDCVFNDPALSFFVMLKDVPHGECAYGPGRPATFYVTEGGSLPLDRIDLYQYLSIKYV